MAWKSDRLTILEEDQADNLVSGAQDHRCPCHAFCDKGNYDFHSYYISSYPSILVQMLLEESLMGRIKPGRKVKVLPPPGSPNPLPGRSNFPASRPIELVENSGETVKNG